jgi:hypothetical protein
MKENIVNTNTDDIRRITEYNLPYFLQGFQKKLPKIIQITENTYLKRTNKCKFLFPAIIPNKRECLICWKEMCNCNKCKNVLKTCCDQYYHIKCLDTWMKCKSLCPICKGFIIILRHIDYDNRTKVKKVVGYETYTFQLYNLDGRELPIQQIWDPVIDIEGLFSDEADDNFSDENYEVEDDDNSDESNILRELERLGEEVFNQQNEYISEDTSEEEVEEEVEEEEVVEEVVQEEVQEEVQEQVQVQEVQEVQEVVEIESSYEIIENSLVIPSHPELQRYEEEKADKESVVIREIRFTSSVIEVV